jgi:hypothetical protein
VILNDLIINFTFFKKLLNLVNEKYLMIIKNKLEFLIYILFCDNKKWEFQEIQDIKED